MLSLRTSITVLFFQEKHAMTILAVHSKKFFARFAKGRMLKTYGGALASTGA